MTYESAFEDPYTAFEELTVMLDDLFAILLKPLNFESESMHIPGSSFPAQAQVDPFRPFAVLLAGTPIS
jgi:alkanesulfonate monooxygenase SsuD/methylene tetrahydromethanopterin reductase-like flavin-dependent oxidoreductase (luciferase family)